LRSAGRAAASAATAAAANDDLQPGFVVAPHGRRLMVEAPTGERMLCHTRGKKSDLVVGDRVLWRATGDEGVIEELLPRRNLLFRQDEWRTKSFAANLDMLLVLVAGEPMFSESQLTRALIAARSAVISERAGPLIVQTTASAGIRSPSAKCQSTESRGSTVTITPSNHGAPHSTAASRTVSFACTTALSGSSCAVQSPEPMSSASADAIFCSKAAASAVSNGAKRLRSVLMPGRCPRKVVARPRDRLKAGYWLFAPPQSPACAVCR